MNNHFSASSNAGRILSWLARHWKRLLGAILVVAAIALGVHEVYVYCSVWSTTR